MICDSCEETKPEAGCLCVPIQEMELNLCHSCASLCLERLITNGGISRARLIGAARGPEYLADMDRARDNRQAELAALVAELQARLAALGG